MATLHLGAQSLESPELELLHRAFAAAELLRYFANAFFVNEAPEDHLSLVGWELIH